MFEQKLQNGRARTVKIERGELSVLFRDKFTVAGDSERARIALKREARKRA